MKHLLNDLTEEEKNSIREQHTGGMKVMNENFSKLVNTKLGDVKPLVMEQSGDPEYVRAIQRFLNEKLHIHLMVDGKTGDNSETSKAIMRYQEMLNKKLGPYKTPLTIDGKFGSNTYKIMPSNDKQRLDDLVAEEGGMIDQFTHWLSKWF